MKKYISIILILLMMFVCGVDVKAFPANIIIEPEGVGLTLDSDLKVFETDLEKTPNPSYPYFHIKNSNKGKVLCTGGKLTYPASGTTCTLSNFADTNQEKGVAYIIDEINETSATDKEKYWWSEFLINSYLESNGYPYASGTNTYSNIINASYNILGKGTYSSIINRAKEAAKKEYENITLNSNRSSLSFAEGDDGYYYSNALKITSNGNYKIALSNNKYSYTKDGDTYTFKIKKSDIALGGTENLTITVSSTESVPKYSIAKNYYCGSNIQTVTLNTTETITLKVDPNIEITGKVSREKTSIKVAKTNPAGTLISGANLIFQTEADYKNKITTKEITTTTSYTAINDLVAGKYYLSEKTAPTGYDKSNRVMEIVISNDGTIKVDGIANDGTIKFSNDLTKTNISKKDATGKSELPGSTLHVLDKDKKSMSCTIIKNGKEEKLDKCTWVSGTKPVQIVGLSKGTYYLQETIAPTGYTLSEEMVSFTVKADGSITDVVMINKLNKVVISKKDVTGKSELPGATLHVLNKDKKSMSCTIIKNGKEEKLDKCTWVSGTKAVELVGLTPGKYYLKETIAPDKYVLSEEMVSFEVKEDQEVTNVEMKIN